MDSALEEYAGRVGKTDTFARRAVCFAGLWFLQVALLGCSLGWLSELVGCLSSGRAVLLVGPFYEQAPRTGSS